MPRPTSSVPGGSGGGRGRPGPAPRGPDDGRGGAGPVAVALGSNVGDRAENLRFGVREVERRLERVASSSVYRSRPKEGVEGGEFLNMCVAGRPSEGIASPRELLRELRYVEMAAGRSPRRPPGRARTLDLDLLLVGDRVIREEGLRVPHPRMAERGFVLRPLAELLPRWRHPEVGATAEELAERAETADLRRADLEVLS